MRKDNGSHRGAKANQWNGSKPHPIHTPTAAPFSLHNFLHDQKQNHHHTLLSLRPTQHTHTRHQIHQETWRGSWPATPVWSASSPPRRCRSPPRRRTQSACRSPRPRTGGRRFSAWRPSSPSPPPPPGRPGQASSTSTSRRASSTRSTTRRGRRRAAPTSRAPTPSSSAAASSPTTSPAARTSPSRRKSRSSPTTSRSSARGRRSSSADPTSSGNGEAGRSARQYGECCTSAHRVYLDRCPSCTSVSTVKLSSLFYHQVEFCNFTRLVTSRTQTFIS
uniref:Photosystem I n=1 Tax=Triticum aestivum TaxID=4565 RepID=A0A2Z6ERY0_WHEAT|nr:photosystem I [Triticum aestivum]